MTRLTADDERYMRAHLGLIVLDNLEPLPSLEDDYGDLLADWGRSDTERTLRATLFPMMESAEHDSHGFSLLPSF